MRVFRVVVATAILLGPGCVPRAVPEASGLPHADLSAASGPTGPAASLPAGHGRLRVAVSWPRGYAAQTIPANTASIALKIEGARSLMVNLTTAAPATESVLPAGPYTLSAVARDQDGQETATGSTEVTVRTGEIVNAGLTLGAHFVPSVTGYQPNGGPGELISLFGLNFARSGVGNSPFKVRFGDALASEVYVKSDTEAHVRIPAGAVNGNMTVVANGVASTGDYPFRVVSSVELFSTDPNAIVLSGQGRPTVVLYSGLSRPEASSSVSLGAIAKDTAGETISNPYVTWRVLGDHSDSMTTEPSTGSACQVSVIRGSFPGPGSGTGTVIVQAGSVSASVDYMLFN